MSQSLECRDWGHAWTASTVEVLSRGYEVTLRCSRCGTLRRRALDSEGYIVGGNRYTYAPGYLVKGTSLHTSAGRAQIRRLLMERITHLSEGEEQ